MKTTKPFDQHRLQRLTEAMIEGRLSAEELAELKSIVLIDDAALESYVDRLCDHAVLSFQRKESLRPVDEARLRHASAFPRKHAGRTEVGPGTVWEQHPERFRGRIIAAAALGIFFTIATLTVFFTGRPAVDGSFVTILKTSNCLWKDTPTTTKPGGRLGSCLLRLERGVAMIRFDCDVLISLEGPTEFEIKDRKHALLHFGRLMAKAESPEGHGFVVDTPEMSIEDLGTKFGLYAPKNRPTELYVIDGEVQVTSLKTDKTLSLHKGESIIMECGNDNYETGDGDDFHASAFQIGTAAGRGKEAWAINDVKTFQKSGELFPGRILKPYMLVKTSTADDPKSDRKAIFSIDLNTANGLDWTRISNVILYLSYGPTELGYASSVPDSTFTVYGLTDESCDDWNPATIDWNGFPGNGPRHTLDGAYWKPLGDFEIGQGSRSGMVEISGDVLKEFIRSDTNGLVTFAIVRNTYAVENYGLVHGFANSHHPGMMPPRLRFCFFEDGTESADQK